MSLRVQMIREDFEKDQKDLLSCPGMPRLLKMEKELLHYYMSIENAEAFLRQKLWSLWEGLGKGSKRSSQLSRNPRLLKKEKELLHYYMSKKAKEAFLRQKLRSL